MLLKFTAASVALLLCVVLLPDQTSGDAAGKVVCYYDSKSFIREGEFLAFNISHLGPYNYY